MARSRLLSSCGYSLAVRASLPVSCASSRLMVCVGEEGRGHGIGTRRLSQLNSHRSLVRPM